MYINVFYYMYNIDDFMKIYKRNKIEQWICKNENQGGKVNILYRI